MKKLDEAALERIIEQITRQVLLLIQEEDETGTGPPVTDPISAHNYLERVQPVVNAGADRIAREVRNSLAAGAKKRKKRLETRRALWHNALPLGCADSSIG